MDVEASEPEQTKGDLRWSLGLIWQEKLIATCFASTKYGTHSTMDDIIDKR